MRPTREAIMQPRYCLQRNLFEADRKPSHVPATLSSVIVRLIGGVLIEALASGRSGPAAATPETKEAAHEQDHV